ncbi:MAG: SusC/RagA family TonB-linked outer membrane protein [Chitinophagaceae bacterium]|nr:SusC/RagA family TonB-linked outer membrane protein [Chitinophagaceae bacterium]
MSKLKSLLAVLVLLFITVATYAQEQTISGVIKDASDNTPLPGVSVKIKGSKTGTTTNSSGAFSIKANKGQVLVFSFIGFKNVEVTVGDNSTVNLSLVETADKQQLGEVVVTAMDIKRNPRELGYSVQSVGGKEVQETQRENFVNALQGRVAGLTITPTNGVAGASSSIVLRGFNSLSLSNEPLFVVDGVVMDNQTMNETSNQGSLLGLASDRPNRTNNYQNRIADINPNDIESITVLKGPEATALYGSQASSGAIIITTKKGGNSQGKLRVNYDNAFRVSEITRFPEFTDKFLAGNNGTANSVFTYFGPQNPNPNSSLVRRNIDAFFQTAFSQTHNLSLDYGKKNWSLRLSGSILDQTGTVPNNTFKRYNLRATGTVKFGSKLELIPSIAVTQSSSRRPIRGNGSSTAPSGYLLNLMVWPGELDVSKYQDPNGDKLLVFATDPLSEIDNPIWNAKNNESRDNTLRYTTTLGINLTPTKWWSINGRFGYDTYVTDGSIFTHPKSFFTSAALRGSQDNYYRNYYGYNHTITTTFKKSLGKFNGRLMVGTMWQDYETQQYAVSGNAIVDINRRDSSNTDPQTRRRLNRAILFGDYNKSINRNLANFGELSLSYNNMVYLTYSQRFESTSILPKKSRDYNYPGASLSMIMTDILPFLKNDKFLKYWKLRTSTASTARLPAPYSNQAVYNAVFNSGNGYALGFDNNNPDLLPERQQTYEIGSEFRLFKDKLNIDAAYYNTLVKDQITEKFRTSYGTGFILATFNTAKTRNEGVEITLNAKPVQAKNFSWNLTVNFNRMWNKVLSLPDHIRNADFYISDTWLFGNMRAGVKQGYPTTTLTGFGYARNKYGDILINPSTGLPLVDQNFTIRGDRNPTFTSGILNSFRYKNFSVSFLWNLKVGGDIFNGTDMFLTTRGRSIRTADRLTPRAVNGVLADGLENSAAPTRNNISVIPFYQQDYYVNNMPEEEFIERDVNWLRLSDITLTYNFTQKVLGKQKVFRTLSMFLTGQDLFLITNYTGADPAVNGNTAGTRGVGAFGFDYGNPAIPIGFNFGIRASF